TYGDLLLQASRATEAAAYYSAALTSARTLDGPSQGTRAAARHIEEQIEHIKSVSEDSKKLAKNLNQVMPGLVPLSDASFVDEEALMKVLCDRVMPPDVRARYWSESGSHDAAFPWRDNEWLTRHRRTVVDRLERKRVTAKADADK